MAPIHLFSRFHNSLFSTFPPHFPLPSCPWTPLLTFLFLVPIPPSSFPFPFSFPLPLPFPPFLFSPFPPSPFPFSPSPLPLPPAPWPPHQVWDLTPQVRALAATAAASAVAAADISPPVARQAPLHIYSGHEDEGFAVDWSPANTATLATGREGSWRFCLPALQLTVTSISVAPAASPLHALTCGSLPSLPLPAVSAPPCRLCPSLPSLPLPAGGLSRFLPLSSLPALLPHFPSLPSYQWSPTEPEVFASSGVDGTVCFWDVRAASRTAPALRVKAHDADVNVISWNRLASCMVASGCDDGSFRIWDLRLLREAGAGKEGGAFIAHFNHHRQPITSIEWSPHESSTLATSCADNQITIWDLSLERDAEEEAEFEAGQKKPQAEAPSDLPPQLLFVHQGQTDIKELHWHPHIPGMLISTAADGFNAFMPSNL
ncbi:unnamed protein product [Closterium sp. NIES-54]